MKKIFLLLISLFSAAVTIILLFSAAIINLKAYPSELTVDRNEEEITAAGEELRILQLSDVQTKNLIECAMAYPTVKSMVKKTEPDLIILTGDNISDDSERPVLDAFISLMDSFEIPWAPVFGNHDYNSALSREEICKAFEDSEYCIFKTKKIDGRYSNYSYDILFEGDAVYSLIFMDSEKSGFTAAQVQWYEEELAENEEKYGKAIPSLAFFHIPIQQTSSAHEYYAENPDAGFYEALKAHGSTVGLFYGHDHENNTSIEYDGVRFTYAMKTGITVYFDIEALGGNVITVTKSGDFNVEQVHWLFD